MSEPQDSALDDMLRRLVAAEVRREISPLVAEVAALRRAVDDRLPKRLLTRSEAAMMLGVSLDSIDRRVEDGTLHAIKVGRSVRIDPNGLRPTDAGEIARLVRSSR